MFAMADTGSRTRTERTTRNALGATATSVLATLPFLMSTVAAANPPLSNEPPGQTPAQAARQDPAEAPASSLPTPEDATQPVAAATANLAVPVTGVPGTAAELDISPPASGTQQQRASDTPIFEKWWFWTAITAVAVTAVIIVATSSGPSAPRTDLGNMVAF